MNKVEDIIWVLMEDLEKNPIPQHNPLNHFEPLPPHNPQLHLKALEEQISKIMEDYRHTDLLIKAHSKDQDLRILELDYLRKLQTYWSEELKK